MEVSAITFEKEGKISVKKNFAVFLGLVFIACLVGTGILVYYLSSCNLPKTVVQTIEVCNRTFVEDLITDSLVEELSSTTTTYTTLVSITRKNESLATLDVRLPSTIKPISYEIRLIPFIFEDNFTFDGEINILVNVSEATDVITLHADELIIDDSSILVNKVVDNKDYEGSSDFSLEVKNVLNDTDRQFLIIYLTKELQANTQYNIYIKFSGFLNDLLQGFYRSSYMVKNEKRWIASTQFQPTDARKAFPCFDEPALKAKFKISLARNKNMTSISNMPRISTEPVENLPNYEWDHFQQSVPMSTYLVAFVVSDFHFLKNGNFSVWARGEAIPQAQYSLDVGPKLLHFFEDYFQIKFPLPKVDMIALPDFAAGAMENWGLITFRESAMLHKKGVSSKSNSQRITSVVAHELAHQWFGNLVTPKWWSDLWLNEGFASYMEYIGTNAINPEWKILDQFVIHELQNVLALDGLKSSHQISIIVNNPNEINDIFDRISYAKGATIIRMMEHFLTSSVFRKGLTNYLNSRRFDSAEQDDLWEALSDQAHKDEVLSNDMSVKQIMDTWTLQTGFPVIFVARVYSDNIVTFTQERFSLGNNKTDSNSTLWWIPITYKGQHTNVTTVWMEATPELIITDLDIGYDDWLLVNIDQTGYYRVNYDNRNWKLLTQQLLNKREFFKFSTTNRAQMIDDSLNLAAAGYLDYEIALNVSTYLVHERDCIPWMAAFTGLDYIQDMFIKTADYDKYKVFMTTLIEGLYKDIGFEGKQTDSQLTLYNRMNLLWRACLIGNLDCITHAVTYFHNWKNSPNPDKNNPISPNLKNVVYCIAIKVGGQEEWDFAWQRYLNTNVGSEKDSILSALGCSRETWILSRYLHWAISEGSGIRKQDSPRVFTAVSNNVIGQEITYRFFKNNWTSIKKYMGSSLMLLNAIVKASISGFNTQEEVNDVKRFASENADELSIVSRTLEQSIEQAEANVRWMNRNYNNIVVWLSNFNASLH